MSHPRALSRVVIVIVAAFALIATIRVVWVSERTDEHPYALDQRASISVAESRADGVAFSRLFSVLEGQPAFESLDETQRDELVAIIDNTIKGYSSDSYEGFIDAMAGLGGVLKEKYYTNQDVEKLWTQAPTAFPWSRLEIDHAVFKTLDQDEEGNLTLTPAGVGSLILFRDTMFDFGYTPLELNEMGCPFYELVMKAESPGGKQSLLRMRYFWVEHEHRWIPWKIIEQGNPGDPLPIVVF